MKCPRHRWQRLVMMTLVLAVLGLFGLGGDDPAQAEPPAITKAKQEAEALRRLIDDLERELGAAIEEFNYATEMLARTKADAQRTHALLREAERDLTDAEVELSARLVAIYKQGRLGLVGMMLEAGSVTDFVESLDMVSRLSAQDAALLVEIKAYRDAKSARAAELGRQIEQQTAYATQVEAARAKVQRRLRANETALAGKEAQIRQMVKEEASRQAALAAAAKKAAEEAARKARLAAQARARARVAGGTPLAVPASASASDVVNIALKYLGSRYVWGGSSPDGFDCSGFVMFVYKQVGVRLPHSSRMQYGYGTPVARNELRPGDLVFFYTPIHHVGIYVGEGKMVHAAGVGKGVRVDEVWSRSYTGACRIVR